MLSKSMLRIAAVLGDITLLEVDAIVNAANEELLRGAGVCGAIFRAAGPQLDEACRALAPCPTGEARVTQGFNAKAHVIVHAVGPVWHGGNAGEPELLASAYRNSLAAARNVHAHSIAFPAISTGTYGYPREAAAEVALRTVREWCFESSEPERIIFCCFSEGDKAVYDALLNR
jgi:O-acetyl-ADP-ribose deacetylase